MKTIKCASFFILIFILTLLPLHAQELTLINIPETGFRAVPGEVTKISAYDACTEIHNNAEYDLFIPTSSLEEWNDFNTKRSECFENQDFDAMEQYFAYRTDESDENDGGNALFATLEYWDGGVVFNNKKNCIAVYKNFEKKKHGIDLNQQGT